MRSLLLAFAATLAISAAAAEFIGPQRFMEAVLLSPQGLVLLGRIMMVYQIVYPATGNAALSTFTAIVFNNLMGLSAVFAGPMLIHAAYGDRVKKLGWRRKLGWSFYAASLRFIAAFYVAMLALPLYAVAALKGPALFMAFEAGYVFLAAYTVYKSSQTSYENFRKTYREALARQAPLAVLLLLLAAAVETVEAL